MFLAWVLVAIMVTLTVSALAQERFKCSTCENLKDKLENIRGKLEENKIHITKADIRQYWECQMKVCTDFRKAAEVMEEIRAIQMVVKRHLSTSQ